MSVGKETKIQCITKRVRSSFGSRKTHFGIEVLRHILDYNREWERGKVSHGVCGVGYVPPHHIYQASSNSIKCITKNDAFNP